MSDQELTTEQALGDEIARVRHGQDVTASDLANRLVPWLAEHDAKVRAETLREFAHSIPGDIHDPRHVADLARGVADHIEKEAGLK